jgi:PTH1 family peptidyl-tRNA hydrolase
MKIVVGLGNPGGSYANSRHNAGFLVVDRLAERWHTSFDQQRSGAVIAKARLHGEGAILAKPQKFMNLSGQPTSALRSYYKVADEDIVVVHDDMEIEFGQVRVKDGGGHGGHNGLRDLKAKLGTGRFVRVRFGVSRPPGRWDPADYVLGSWSKEQSAQLSFAVDRAADAVEAVVRDGISSAMNTFNTQAGSTAAQGPQA